MNTKVPSLTGEQVREAYQLSQLERRKAAEKVRDLVELDPIVLLKLLPNDEGFEENLIPTAMLSNDLEAEIKNAWAGTGVADFLVFFNQGTTPIIETNYPRRPPFPLAILIPSGHFQAAGTYTLRYSVYNGGGDNNSSPSTFTVDRDDPHRNIVPPQIEFDTNVITPDYLNTNNGLPFTLPLFSHPRPGDTAEIHMKIMDTGVIHHVASIAKRPVQGFDPLVPMTGVIAKDVFINSSGDPIFEDGTVEFYYYAYSRAGNQTKYPDVAQVSIAFKPMASGLKKAIIPLATESPDPLIDRSDAILGVVVEIEEFLNYLPKDEIEVTWGARSLARFPVGSNPQFPLQSPAIPYGVLISEGDASGEGPKTVSVDYRVMRGLIEAKPDTAVTTSVDLRIPGPVNPNPGPENPLLGTVVVYGGGANPEKDSIRVEDIGQPVRVQLPAYPNMQAGDVLEVVWNNTLTGATHVVQGTETDFDIRMPFDVVTEHGDGPAVPVQIQITNPSLPPGNPTITVLTPVSVNTFQLGTLTSVIFPDRNRYNALGCCQSIWEGAKARIGGDPVNFAEKDTVTVFWVGRDELGADVPDTDGSQAYTLTAAQATDGFDHVVAFAEFVQPIAKEKANLFVWYELQKVGGASGKADPSDIEVTYTSPDGCECIGPGVCDTSACRT
ncbi:hypothetical protein [Pseudomonas sp. NUPR-001]|uniref:hypothetical protein n=1 Tax=Pseudomonas sp. NUPR-001 TaxID=3416058 RepID=UPI003F9B4226